jgi:hypothetical protein
VVLPSLIVIQLKKNTRSNFMMESKGTVWVFVRFSYLQCLLSQFVAVTHWEYSKRIEGESLLSPNLPLKAHLLCCLEQGYAMLLTKPFHLTSESIDNSLILASVCGENKNDKDDEVTETQKKKTNVGDMKIQSPALSDENVVRIMSWLIQVVGNMSRLKKTMKIPIEANDRSTQPVLADVLFFFALFLFLFFSPSSLYSRNTTHTRACDVYV